MSSRKRDIAGIKQKQLGKYTQKTDLENKCSNIRKCSEKKWYKIKININFGKLTLNPKLPNDYGLFQLTSNALDLFNSNGGMYLVSELDI